MERKDDKSVLKYKEFELEKHMASDYLMELIVYTEIHYMKQNTCF